MVQVPLEGNNSHHDAGIQQEGGGNQHGSGSVGGRGQSEDHNDSFSTDIAGRGRGRGRGRNIRDITVEENDPRFYNRRGYSYGGFGTFPLKPINVRIANNE